MSAGPEEQGPGDPAREPALTDVRELLDAAARGDVDAAQMTDSLRGYLEEHGPALRSAAAAAGEEVRRQLLQQLYGWRRQLDQQLGSPSRDGSPGRPADSSP